MKLECKRILQTKFLRRTVQMWAKRRLTHFPGDQFFADWKLMQFSMDVLVHTMADSLST